ncbi:cysteine proteinase [Aaosphaeria arxii CBS 175.79]|uniref:ubiquitinyl hydrolase 1 n=1 Tax=Aaosphaeria arxii CBS 175.79 TaxID=1450172 RepID=A0A6A5XIT0_9PLEO|nr:cysteine proteinase [Aaosphaeria arxii CBS 175.79]KAF2012741.1 cysteine proteinase [Aaosphaeria arxii CBS 175.79]
MNGVTRFLSRRDKNGEKRSSKRARSKSQSRQVPSDLYKIFTNEEEPKPESVEDKKVKTLVQRLRAVGVNTLKEEHVQHALSKYPDDLDKAYDLLILANDSFDGILREYDPNVTMVGAVNRNMVTCYLDALLFAMFARLDSFEAMLYDSFSDEPRKKLAGTLRLWVNLLRSGELINVELTKHLQDAMAKSGWEAAAEICQQDASEAFTFITGALELPLLTLKMDIYHTGREDKEDDHKFVNERLLEVAIPEPSGDNVITLEDCLENYFNNRIEVKRFLQRQNTLTSLRTDSEKNHAIHIETVELTGSGSNSPLISTPTSLAPSTPTVPIRPPLTINGRRRADSIFNERLTTDGSIASEKKKPFDEKRLLEEMLNDTPGTRPRSASFRKEVMMPAWQFFSLIPWYTDNVPQTDAQVAAHFSAKRPVLGICLKRYSMELNGTSKRLSTYIDIPLEIGLPHFVTDDNIEHDGPLFGNFKLVLQSVVCHRGVSVDSGHYVSLVRANVPTHSGESSSSKSGEPEDKWFRFDDLASPRVADVDIKQALAEESPYLLFFQVQPIDEELARGAPPPYTAAAKESDGSSTADPSATEGGIPQDLIKIDESSEDVGRASFSSTRPSTVGEDREGSVTSLERGRTAPTTPAEDLASFLSASRRGSKTMETKSRPSSQSGENRLSFTLSRLTGRGSKEKLQIPEEAAQNDPVIIVNEVQSQESGKTETVPTDTTKLPVHDKHHSNTTKAGKNKKEKNRFRSKSPKPRQGGGGHKDKNRPDRECIVM